MLEIFDKSRRRVAIAENAHDVSEDRKINSLWYLTFRLPYGDPKTEFCQPFYFVRWNGGELYRIMPATEQITEYGAVEYRCEHVLATLLDKVLFGYHVVGNLGVYTADCINYVLNHQDVKNWTLAECDFRRQFEYGWEQENLLSALFSIAAPLTDYMWVTDTHVYPWRLSLKSLDSARRPDLYIRRGKNMLSYNVERDPQQICTRLYPLGYGEGINQLTIKEVNGGVPYLQSPQQYIDRYGIVERVWIDRRYEDATSLKAAAAALLAELQDPSISYEIGFAELDSDAQNTAEIGKRVRILHPDSGEWTDTYITGLTYDYGNVKNSTITVENHSTSVASSVADLADRQRIEQSYSQGATQLYSQALQANCDTQNGAVIDFFIPSEMRVINKVLAKIRMDRFLSYSQSTEAAAAYVGSTSTVDETQSTSHEGGGSVLTSESGGGIVRTTSSYSKRWSTSAVSVGGSIKDASLDGDTGNGIGTTSGHYHKVQAVGHSHKFEVSNHFHTMPESSHTHTIDLEPHTHDLDVPSHKHSFSIPGHNHTVEIPAHSHDIKPGIYPFGNAKQFSIYVNGKFKATFAGTTAELDITSFLLDADKKIPRGSWLSVEVRPDDLAYISVDLIFQGFVQSRGDATV